MINLPLESIITLRKTQQCMNKDITRSCKGFCCMTILSRKCVCIQRIWRGDLYIYGESAIMAVEVSNSN